MNLQSIAPCYIYDEKMIRSGCTELKNHFPAFDFLYSVKCNPFAPVVRTLAEEGFGADAASYHEVEKAVDAGMKPEDIYFSAPGKTRSDMLKIWGRCELIADSLHEIEVIDEIAAGKGETARLGIRVHPPFGLGSPDPGSSKFGIDLEDMDALKNVLSACTNVQLTGLHVHLRSQTLDAPDLAQYYKDIMAMALSLREELGVQWKYLNFGSGIGVVYDAASERPMDLDLLGRAAAEVAEINRTSGLNARLLIESGRYSTCHAGRYYTPVIDKKVSHGVTYLVTQNGLNGFLRPGMSVMLKKAMGGNVPMLEPFYTNANAFEIRLLSADGTAKTGTGETVNVCGNLCTGLDVIADSITLPRAEIGDIIEITNAGSYACTLSSLFFASQDLPGEYLKRPDGTLEG